MISRQFLSVFSAFCFLLFGWNRYGEIRLSVNEALQVVAIDNIIPVALFMGKFVTWTAFFNDMSDLLEKYAGRRGV